MSYTRARSTSFSLRAAVLVALIIAVTTIPSGIAMTHAYEKLPDSGALDAHTAPQAQEAEDREPEANLPFLFAVFFITWAAFFGYVFVMSRRQREMRGEVNALKRALADKELQRLQAVSGGS